MTNNSEEDFRSIDKPNKDVIKLFSVRSKIFPKDRGADAREMARSQGDRWFHLISDSLDRFDREIPTHAIEVRSLLSNLATIVRNNNSRFFRTLEDADNITIEGKIPILSSTITLDVLPPETYVIAAILCEIYNPVRIDSLTFRSAETRNDATIPSILLVDLTRYTTEKALYSFFVESSASEIKTSLNKVISDAATAIATSRERTNKTEKAFSELFSKSKSSFDEFIQDSTTKIEAARALAREASTLEGAIRIWSNKHKTHNYFFLAVAITLLALSAALVYEFIQNFSEIKNAIPTKSDGDVAYGFVILCLIPIISVAWVVRIFTRWAVNSLTLSEDAQQRRAMIETYLRLVANPEAKMEQADRVIILNALFRPLPGTAQEDISPPTLADFVKDAFSTKSK